MLQYFVDERMNLSEPTSVLTLKMLHGAIRSGDLKTIKEIDPELASVLSIYRLKTEDFLEYYSNFAYDYLQGQIEIAEIKSGRQNP
jgi:hypothetical protein